jgi:hypothetical protein
MSWFSKLFGGGSAPASPASEPVEYEGFLITPDPAKVADGWRVQGTIEKDGRSHTLIRADTLRDRDGAVEATLTKARQTIDQMGERLLDG